MSAPIGYDKRTRRNLYFVPGEGISRDIITSDICKYLDNDATVKPGEYEGRRGYLLYAYRNLTSAMIQDLRNDSLKWEKEKDRTRRDRERGGQSQSGRRGPEDPSYSRTGERDRADPKMDYSYSQTRADRDHVMGYPPRDNPSPQYPPSTMGTQPPDAYRPSGPSPYNDASYVPAPGGQGAAYPPNPQAPLPQGYHPPYDQYPPADPRQPRSYEQDPYQQSSYGAYAQDPQYNYQQTGHPLPPRGHQQQTGSTYPQQRGAAPYGYDDPMVDAPQPTRGGQSQYNPSTYPSGGGGGGSGGGSGGSSGRDRRR